MKDRTALFCKILIIHIFFFILIFNLSAINFQDINLSNDDRLIFRVDFENQHAVFTARLTDMSMRQLTAFPEKLYLVDNGRTIFTLSRFGAMNIPTAGGIPTAIPGYPSFEQGNLPLPGRLQEIAASADGQWIIYIEPVSPGYGNLLLTNAASGAKYTVTEMIELPGADFPVKWSPDSRFFVYSKSGRLFYYPILNNLSSLVDERFRMIGEGNINSVLWGENKNFYYLTGNTLYRVINPELFTRTMYGDFLSVGNATSVLPMDFDPGFDRYWIAPDSGSIIINKGGKGVFLFLLGETQNPPPVLPHISLPYMAENFNVYWSGSGLLTILYTAGNELKVWRLEIKNNTVRQLEPAAGTQSAGEGSRPIQNSVPVSSLGALSPDETKIIFWGEKGLELWDYTGWRRIQRLSDTQVFSCAWVNNRQFVTGNTKFIEEINISQSSYPRRRICLSGADEIGFEDTRGTPRVLARSGSTWFATDEKTAWTTVNNIQPRQISFSSERFRVFLEPQSSGYFKNIPLIRNLQSFGTVPLTANHTTNKAFTPGLNQQTEPRLRLPGRPAQTALCFDLYDDDAGLMRTLTALSRFNIKATFFLNGEFLRRNPQAARAIAEAGHETGSMFYAPIDLSDTRYRITQSFISQGLARNEDEFNRITGRELSIIWHPPFHRSSDMINSAAAASGYRTVVRNIDPGDWLSREDILRLNMRQIPPSEMIDQIIKNNYPGAIIPVRLGILPGGRDEYLFQHIEVLIDALIRSGSEIVPVSAVLSR